MKELFRLFAAFFKMGLFTFGGGLAMLPLIQRTVVEDYQWMTEEEMIDCIAVTQAMPGVIAINAATYVGNKRKGFAGALSATLGVILPSFIVIILAVLFLGAIGENRYVDGAFTGIKAASCGLILYSAYKLGKQTINGWLAGILALASFIPVAFFNLNAVFAILCGALIGYIAVVIKSARDKKGEQEGDEKR